MCIAILMLFVHYPAASTRLTVYSNPWLPPPGSRDPWVLRSPQHISQQKHMHTSLCPVLLSCFPPHTPQGQSRPRQHATGFSMDCIPPSPACILPHPQQDVRCPAKLIQGRLGQCPCLIPPALPIHPLVFQSTCYTPYFL